jgi:ABC-type nitrate/sulfonate/bicarbonate transport system permease component
MSVRLRRFAGFGPAFVLAVVLIACWELYVRAAQVSVRILPAPSAIVQALFNNWNVISVNTIQTLLETVIGMVLATLFGLLMAILLDISPLTRRAIYPLLIISQTIPIVALAPLLLIWMGFGLEPKVIVVILYCFFPIAVACADGLSSAEPEMLNLLRSMRATRWQTLWLVRLPGAMPAFFSGLRIAVTYSMTGAIVGEFVGAYQGLGIFMVTSANSGAIDLVFAAILVTALLSLLLFGLVSLMERIALPWYHGSGSGAKGGPGRWQASPLPS